MLQTPLVCITWAKNWKLPYNNPTFWNTSLFLRVSNYVHSDCVAEPWLPCLTFRFEWHLLELAGSVTIAAPSKKTNRWRVSRSVTLSTQVASTPTTPFWWRTSERPRNAPLDSAGPGPTHWIPTTRPVSVESQFWNSLVSVHCLLYQPTCCG